jgi:hypothetical protein
MDSSIRSCRKNFSDFLICALQLFGSAVILRVVVGQSSKRVNGVKRSMLVAGIVFVGLFDLAFTTFINHEELVRLPEQPPIEVADTVRSAAVTVPLDIDPVDIEVLPQPPTRYTATSRPAKFRRTFIERKGLNDDHANLAGMNASLSTCRTVSYPFVGDGYIVQVTDDVGCLTSASLRSKRDHLIAKTFAPRQRRW